MKPIFTPRCLAYVMLLLIIQAAFFNYLPAQQPQWQWAQMGGSNVQPDINYFQYADNVVTDTVGNSYVSGTINSPSCQFSNFNNVQYVTTYGDMDIFLAKYNCSGNLQWVNIMGTIGEDNPCGLQLGHDGMIYLYGYEGYNDFNISTPFGVLVAHSTQPSLFLTKFSPVGALEKIKLFDQSTTSTTGPYSVLENLQLRSDGNFIICGVSNGGLLVDSINIQSGGFLAEIDTGLNVLWAKCIANAAIVDRIPSFDRFVLDGSNNIYFAGFIDGQNTINDSVIWGGQILKIPTGAIQTAVVMKLDSMGNYLWHRLGTSTVDDGAGSPTVDADGNLIIGAATQNGDTIFGFPFNYYGSSLNMLCILKLNGATGELMYGILSNNSTANDPGGGSIDLRYGYNHNFYLAMQLYGNIIFDTISITTGYDIWETLIWEFKDEDTAFRATTNYTILSGSASAGDVENDAPYKLTFDQQGNWYACGTIAGSIYTPRDTISYAYGNGGQASAIFVAKFGLPCGDTNSLIPPVAPDDLVATPTGPHAITITWQNNAQYVQQFYVYRSLDSINWAVIDSTPASVTTYIDVNVQQNVLYWYKASAVNNAGQSQFTNSDTAEIRSVGITEIAQNNLQLLVQPNPNRGAFTLTVATDALVAGRMIIYSTDGRPVLEQAIQVTQGNNWYPVQMQNAAAGIYIITINTEDGAVARLKFVLE